MVLKTCRVVLRNAASAEDAFQATFFGLGLYGAVDPRSRRARRLAPSSRLSDRHPSRRGWHTKKRSGAVCRSHPCRRSFTERAGRRCTRHPARRGRPAVGKYRLPLLLCDRQGKTQAQAAYELNCSEATVRRRLAGARDVLLCSVLASLAVGHVQLTVSA